MYRNIEDIVPHFFQEFDGLWLYGSCAYIIISLISLGGLFNRSSWFPWVEMLRCLLFLGYQMYSPIVVDSNWSKLALYAVRLFYLYSALTCKTNCVQQLSPIAKTKSN